MTTYGDLRAGLVPADASGLEVPVLYIAPDADVDAAIAAAVSYFVNNPGAGAVGVVSGTSRLGDLTREAADQFVADAGQRGGGFGVADGFVQLGPPGNEAVAFHCPVVDCSTRLWLILYWAAAPPTCPYHPGTILLPVS